MNPRSALHAISPPICLFEPGRLYRPQLASIGRELGFLFFIKLVSILVTAGLIAILSLYLSLVEGILQIRLLCLGWLVY